MILLILAVLSFILCAYLGAWMASKAGMPRWVGAVVGGIFHLPGLVVLAIIDVFALASTEV